MRVSRRVTSADPMLAEPSGNDEWHTPPEYLRAARAVMGGIDCDPASNAIAQMRVRATVFYTKMTDGLRRPWHGRVWLNPPYSGVNPGKFTDCLLDHVRRKDVTQAVVLVNASTETLWFHRLIDLSTVFCLVKGRIAFLRPDGSRANGNRFGQAIFYVGPNVAGFEQHFGPFGEIGRAHV